MFDVIGLIPIFHAINSILIKRDILFENGCFRIQLHRFFLGLLSCIPLLTVSSPVKGDDPTGLFGVFPFLPPTKIFQIYQPIVEDLNQLLHQQLILRTRVNYSEFSRDITQQRYDIAFIQPFDYVKAQMNSYLPLARPQRDLIGVFLVKTESNIHSLADLKGLRIALPPQGSALSHLLNITLKREGVNESDGVTPIYSNSHFSCFQHVILGKADVCLSVPMALEQLKKKGLDRRLRTIGQTSPIPPPLFVVHSRVGQKQISALQQHIISWDSSESGSELLKHLKFPPFIKPNESEYIDLSVYLF